ncbi:hypothetical protein LUZ60_005779 [Juncus effusus]|nr:hypothetical protein LUZ60_005779 [Juncus effusus]
MASKGEGGEVEMAVGSSRPEILEAGRSLETVSPVRQISFTRLIFASMVAGGVQYGWALQLSLLTPYIQTLGLSHALSSVMWICGPIAGFVVQPCVGLWSDRCKLRIGRRRPFILVGCLLICLAVIIIGFSSDIGYALGDTKLHCRDYHGARWHAAIVFILGFWVLDFSNNSVQGPARALMADLSGKHGCSAANGIFCSWMALGNIVGYSAGSNGNWHKWFPFLMTKACCEACANLKGAFLIAVIVLLGCMVVTMIFANEVPLTDETAAISDPNSSPKQEIEIVDSNSKSESGFKSIITSFKNLPPGMHSVLLITGLTWLSWFPFILYDTDWMGREIFHGSAKGNPNQVDAYNRGVREGAFGLLLNSIVLGVSSFIIDPMCKKFTSRIVWVMSNFFVCAVMAGTIVISVWSTRMVKGTHWTTTQYIRPDKDVKAAALTLFAVLGFPMAILYSVPFAVVAQLVQNEGGGQGLCTGVLNIAIVVPQVIVALGAGQFDALLGQGNIPAFALASGVALACGFAGFFMLPKLAGFKTAGIVGGH